MYFPNQAKGASRSMHWFRSGEGIPVVAEVVASAGLMELLPDSLHPDSDLPAGEAGSSLLKVHEILETHLPPGEISIYEAGGGAASYLPADLLKRSRVTVVDIDPIQIAKNAYAAIRICGDLQTHRLPGDSIDLVACYNVIEHLPDAEAALERFSEALKPGGLLLIGAPHPHSLSGLVTRFSPHGFHVWYYRHIRGNLRAGEPGEPPFPVHYHRLVLPRRLKAFLAARGFETVYERVYESPRYAEMRQSHSRLARIVDGATTLMNVSFAGRINVRRGDYHLILRKIGTRPDARA